MPYTARITIPFADADPAGLVYYPNILHYCHLAMEEFFQEHCGVDYSSLISDERVGFATVHIESDFLAPLVYGDRITVEVTVLQIGNSSLKLGYILKRVQDAVVCARVEQVHVALDLVTKQTQLIPTHIRKKLETA